MFRFQFQDLKDSSLDLNVDNLSEQIFQYGPVNNTYFNSHIDQSIQKVQGAGFGLKVNNPDDMSPVVDCFNKGELITITYDL